MKLRRMEFGGFRTFAEPTKFNFGSAPGLYFLEGGDNEVDPELGSNGVGKSTVWSALCWILFGKTADGLKAGDLKSWQSNDKGYYGKLWIGRSLVVRKWHPNKLTLDGVVVEQAALEKALDINFKTFTSAVVFSQDGAMFFDLLPAQKLALFTALLKLDDWILYSAVAKATAEDLKEKLHAMERGISRLEGKLDMLATDDLKVKRNAWRADKSALENALRREIRQSKKEADTLQKALKRAKRHKHKLANQIESAKLEEGSALENYTEAKAVEDKIVWEAAQLQKQITTDHEHRKSVVKTKAGVCDHCGQVISKNRLQGHVKKLDKVLNAKRAMLTVLAIDCHNAESSKKMYGEELEAAGRQLDKILKWHAKTVTDVASLSKDAALVLTSLELKAERLATSHKECNPFIPLIHECEEEEARLSDKLKRKEKRHGRMQKKCADVSYWIQGFKDVRLFLIEEALTQLEVETNRALSDLGFTSEWRIRYGIDRRSKTGSTVSGFNVSVQSPNSIKAVPFAAWSGGEKQRLKLAGSIGFIELMRARIGLDLGLEVYDEPTQHLSPQGIDNLLEMLRMRALETGKQIWLVDHHTLDYGDFAGRAIVNKTKEGSTLWQ